MEELLASHKKQQRDLQSRITQKKKNATKKTRKGVDDECAALERELADKQNMEIAALKPTQETQSTGAPAGDAESLTRGVEDSHTGSDPDQSPPTFHQPNAESSISLSPDTGVARGKKPNRQKARLARRAAEQEAAVAQAANEAADMPDQRKVERDTMQAELETRNLTEREVRSDGHCMYAAIADQLEQVQISLQTNDGLQDYQAVRRDAATFMNAHPNDFAPFLDEPLAAYVDRVRDTAEWGGHLELSALARFYNIRIHVLQGSGRVETIESSKEPKAEVWLAYYRHSFGLGEHYNSLRRKS